MAASTSTGRRDVPPSTWLRSALLVAVLGAGFVAARTTPLGGLLDEETLTGLIGPVRDTWWSPVVLLGLYTVTAPLGLPMAPLLVGGALFGAVRGSLYNVAGLLVGATLSYQLARLLGRDLVTRITGPRLRRAERAFERHGFWPLVQTRFLPLPFPIVNFGAALAGIGVGRFVSASIMGLVPSTVLHTCFISALISSHGRDRAVIGAAYAVAFVGFNALLSASWIGARLRRRRRYRELLRRRAAGRSSAARSAPAGAVRLIGSTPARDSHVR